MIALLQRVNHASVTIEGRTHAEINRGLLVFIGLEAGDTLESGEKLLQRILAYRLFPDEKGRMNRSLTDTAGELLLVSQFTLVADTAGGLRPGFSRGMPPQSAKTLYEQLVKAAQTRHPNKVASGIFAADMKIQLENDGPVTFLLRT